MIGRIRPIMSGDDFSLVENIDLTQRLVYEAPNSGAQAKPIMLTVY